MKKVVIVGSGPTGLAAALKLLGSGLKLSVTLVEKEPFSTGGLRNDCKMNFTWPIGFPDGYWTREQAEHYLAQAERDLEPRIMDQSNLEIYTKRAERLGVELLHIRQTHLGTDGGLELIKKIHERLLAMGAELALGEEVLRIDTDRKVAVTDKREIPWDLLVIAPGRKGFQFLQNCLVDMGIPYVDNVVDIGCRVETRIENYPVVHDYYDPKFLLPGRVRTFCTNSGAAHVVKEKYTDSDGRVWYSVNGHAWSGKRASNGLVNFAMLRTVNLTEPLASGHKFAEMLGVQAALLGNGQPIMQRVGDFRLGRRSRSEGFTGDLYDFEPTLKDASPGDVSLAMPAKILHAIWKGMKLLDTIVPGVLHPGTILYYPEIKMYANRPEFRDDWFQVRNGIYMAGDGAGTSRGITAAWASGLRVAEGILRDTL
jgi:uncharacterized FAD-dependent dehydrogenase